MFSTTINAQLIDSRKSYDIIAEGYISWLVIVSPSDTITTYSFTPYNSLNKEYKHSLDTIIYTYFKNEDLITYIDCHYLDYKNINLLKELTLSKSFTLSRSVDFPFFYDAEDYIKSVLDTSSIYHRKNIPYVQTVFNYVTPLKIDSSYQNYIIVKWLDRIKIEGEVYNLNSYDDFFNLQSSYLDASEITEKGVRIGDNSNYIIAKNKPTKMANNDNYPILIITKIEKCLSSYCREFKR